MLLIQSILRSVLMLLLHRVSMSHLTGTHQTNKTYKFLRNQARLTVPKRAKVLAQAAKLLIPFCKFPENGAIYKQHVNKFVRNGVLPRASVVYDALPDKYKCEVNVMTFRLYNIILKLKDILLSAASADEDVECYLRGVPSSHEGFVLHGKHSVKLVNRLEFSQANFNLNKNWTNEKFSDFLTEAAKSTAGDEAKKRGLSHVGYGYYGRPDGTITHRSVNR